MARRRDSASNVWSISAHERNSGPIDKLSFRPQEHEVFRSSPTLEISEVVILEESRVSERSGGANATLGELVTDVRRAVAVSSHFSRRSAVITVPVIQMPGISYPTHAYFVPVAPYFVFTASTHLGTDSAEKSCCLFFQAS